MRQRSSQSERRKAALPPVAHFTQLAKQAEEDGAAICCALQQSCRQNRNWKIAFQLKLGNFCIGSARCSKAAGGTVSCNVKCDSVAHEVSGGRRRSRLLQAFASSLTTEEFQGGETARNSCMGSAHFTRLNWKIAVRLKPGNFCIGSARCSKAAGRTVSRNVKCDSVAHEVSGGRWLCHLLRAVSKPFWQIPTGI